MRISRGAATALVVVGGGVAAFFLLRKKSGQAAEAPAELDPSEGEVDEQEGVIRLPEAPVVSAPAPLPPLVTIPDVTVRPPPVRVVAPPPLEIPEEAEEVLEELEPIAPPFVPPPISRPIPAPPRQDIQVPPLPPPSLEHGIPDLISLPPQTGRGTPIPIPIVLPPPVSAEPPQPDVPDDTALLVQLMLDKEGGRWKVEEPELADWLQARGQARSTKFGPGSAALMAEEIGTLPIVRFWPMASGTNPQRALDEYRALLREIADDKPEPHRSQLKASALREKGQSFGPPQGDGGIAPITPRVEIDLIGEQA